MNERVQGCIADTLTRQVSIYGKRLRDASIYTSKKISLKFYS